MTAFSVGEVTVDVAIDAGRAKEKLKTALAGIREKIDVTANIVSVTGPKKIPTINVRAKIISVDEPNNLPKLNFKADLDLKDIPNLSSLGGGGGGGGSSRFPKRWLLAFQAVIAGGGHLITALAGVGGALVAVGGAAMQAVGGLAALAPIAVGVGGALAGVVIGAKDVAPAISTVSEEFAAAAKSGEQFSMSSEKIQEAMKGLTPEAKDFVTAWSELLPGFQKFKKAAEAKLFAGLGDSLRQLSQKAIPDIQTGLLSLTGSANTVFKGWAERFSAFNWAGLFEGLGPSVEAVGGGIGALGDALFTFIRAITPAATVLAELFKGWAEGLAATTKAGAESGALSAGMMTFIESLKTVFGLIGAVAKALFTLFNAGASTGNSFISTLTDIVNRWTEWMKSTEGQEALAGFFSMVKAIIAGMVPLVQGLAEAFRLLVTPEMVVLLADLMSSLGQIIPVLAQIIALIAETEIINTIVAAIAMIGQAIQPILGPLMQMATGIAQMFEIILSSIGPPLMALGETIGAAITPLIGPFNELARVIGTSFGQIVAVLIPIFGQLVTALAPFWSALMSAVSTILPPLAAAFTGLAQVVGGLLVQAVNTIVPALIPLVNMFAQFAAEVLPQLMEGLLPVIEQIGTMFMSVLSALLPVLQPILEIFFNLIQQVLPPLMELFSALVEAIQPLVDLIIQTFVPALMQLVPILSAVAAIVADAIGIIINILQILIPIVTTIITVMMQFVSILINMGTILLSIAVPAIAGIISIFKSLWDMVAQIVIPIFEAFGSVVSTIVSAVIGYFNGFRTTVSNAINSVIETFKRWKDNVIGVFQAIVDFASGLWQGLTDLLKKPFQAFLDFVLSIPGRIGDILNKIPGVGIVKDVVGFLNPFAAGGIVNGATPALLGEAGPEAIIPLTRPLSMIDPSVRAMAEMIREGKVGKNQAAGIGAATGRTYNITQNIQLAQADPEAVARSTVNRLMSTAMR